MVPLIEGAYFYSWGKKSIHERNPGLGQLLHLLPIRGLDYHLQTANQNAKWNIQNKTKHQNNKNSHSESWISDWPIVTGIIIIILSLILLGFNSSKSIFKDNISSCHWRFFCILSQLLLHFVVFVWAMMSQTPCGSF